MSQLTVLVNNIDILPFILNFNSKHTRRAYISDLGDFFQFLDGRGVLIQSPSDLQLTHFIAYRDFLQKNNLTPKTVARKLSAIKSLMNWFLSSGVINNNPATSLRIPKADVTKPTNALSDEEVRAMFAAPNLDTFEGLKHSLILHLLFILGLRRSEVASIQKSDIISVDNSAVLRVRGKGAKIREVPLSKEVEELYKKYVSLLDTEFDTLFNIKPSAIYYIFKRYASKIGLTKIVSPHSARATAATKALENNNPITAVADMLGHENINTTQIYWKRRNVLKNSPVHKIKY